MQFALRKSYLVALNHCHDDTEFPGSRISKTVGVYTNGKIPVIGATLFLLDL